MTSFDPAFALKVMRRRQSDVNRWAAEILLEKFKLQMDGAISHWGPEADALDKRVHALWDEADSYDSVIKYLEDRIWDEKTFAEKTWALLEHRDFRAGVEMVEDVLEARRDVAAGFRVDTLGYPL